MGTVGLTVSDLDRSRAFYEHAIGLRPTELADGKLALGVAGAHPLIELRGDSSASRLNRRAPGLYHLAILVPSRLDLAFALARLAQERWPLDGASDHLVSEALYLSDPDGNGIEIYRDRPRADWPRADGQLRMATLPLDLDNVLGELRSAAELQLSAPSGTSIGHIHLQVADLAQAEAFYHGVLGFDVMVRGFPGLYLCPPAATTTTSGSIPGTAPARARRSRARLGFGASRSHCRARRRSSKRSRACEAPESRPSSLTGGRSSAIRSATA